LSGAAKGFKSFGQNMLEGIGGISSGFDGMAVGLGSLKTAIEQVIGLAANLDSQITGIFDSAAAAVGEGLMAGGTGVFNFAKDSVQTGMEFDTVMSNIAATMGKTREEINKTVVQTENFTGTLGKFAEKLGAETKFTTAQAAQGLLILAQAGLTAKEQIEALPPILSLASAGAIDLDTSATYVTAAVMGFRDSMENASYYADMISKGATLAKTDVNMLGAAFSGAAATGATYNQTAKSTETALLRLANMNVVGMEAANAYNRVMMDLFTATDDGKEALNELGIAMYDASTGEARDLNDIINELSAALSKYNDEARLAKESKIFSAWGMKAFDKMAATSTDTLEVFDTELSNVTGAASKQAGTQLEALSGKLAILNSAFEAVKIQISKMIMPEFGSFVEQLSTGLGKAAEQLSEGDFKGAFYELGNTVGDLINKGIDDILASGEKAGEFVDGLIVFATKIVNVLIDRAPELLPAITDFVTDTLTKVINAFATIVQDPEKMGKIIGTINLIITKIQSFLDNNEDTLFTIFDTLLDSSIGILLKLFVLKRKTIASILWREAKEIIGGFAENWWSEFNRLIIDRAVEGWEVFANSYTNAVMEKVDLLKARLSKWWNGEKEQIIAIKDWFLDGWSEFANGWTNKVTETIDSVKEAFGQVKLAITDIVDKARTWGKDMIDNFVSGITEMKDKLGEKVNEIAETISSFLHFSLPEKGPLASSDEWMPDFMKNLADGIENNRGLVQNAISNLTDDMKVKPEIVTAKGNKGTTENYTISFNIQNVNGATEESAATFARRASELIYTQIRRTKAATS
jgi:TP901 family phage tail tape measure protein